MLLKREDVNPNIPDKEGRTPLSWAAGKGYNSVVKMLLYREDINIDARDKDGRTPLSWSAGNGNDDALKILLEREDVNPNTPDKDGRTPLSWAAERGHIGAAEMLLQRSRIIQDIVVTDPAGRTTLKRTSGTVVSQWLGDQGSVPRAAGSNASRDHLVVELSESSLPHSKRVRRF